MGEIALGRVKGTKGFEKLVVLKRLRADAEREDHMQMFDVEQELMSRIEHPNIVKVFDQPIIDNTPYLAMEYVRGRNLDQIIRQAKDAHEQISVPFSLTAISEVLRGLAFVHRLKDNEGKALGVVHQDITPSNIMVSFFGEVKITDFGISYVTSRDGGLRRGVLKGKPRYVAPEVLAGKRVNNRADIYGVGVVLYEMLTLNPLFARATVKETLAAVARGELPDFDRELPLASDGLKQIFKRSLAKDPTDRYRTAEEMGADVVAELAKTGGAISPAKLGYLVRQHFRSDPDVPEIDPSFEAALSAESQPVLPSSFRPPDLSQTLSELDRLLGPRQSTDLFTLPPDLKSELAGIADMDPFLALTPIPDFVWDAQNDSELLKKAGEAFGGQGFGPKEPPALGIPPSQSSPGRPFAGMNLPQDDGLARKDVSFSGPGDVPPIFSGRGNGYGGAVPPKPQAMEVLESGDGIPPIDARGAAVPRLEAKKSGSEPSGRPAPRSSPTNVPLARPPTGPTSRTGAPPLSTPPRSTSTPQVTTPAQRPRTDPNQQALLMKSKSEPGTASNSAPGMMTDAAQPPRGQFWTGLIVGLVVGAVLTAIAFLMK
jgi:serine/threonine-protein kinase